MNYIWIEEQGCADAAQLSKKLLELCGENHLYLAYFTDSFTSGNMSGIEMEKLSVDKLLEIRIFSDEMEFLARRSRLGTDFKWRLASDQARTEKFKELKNTEEGKSLPPKEEMTYLIQYHTLDIKKRLSENRILSTVGGIYNLPLKENESKVKVMTYLSYEDIGMAAAVDFRICGFC